MWPRQLHIYVTFGILISKKASLLKFRYCEKATKFEKKSPTFFWNYLVTSNKLGDFYKFLLSPKNIWTLNRPVFSGVKYTTTWKKIYRARFSFIFQRQNISFWHCLCFKGQYFFVTMFCGTNLFKRFIIF